MRRGPARPGDELEKNGGRLRPDGPSRENSTLEALTTGFSWLPYELDPTFWYPCSRPLTSTAEPRATLGSSGSGRGVCTVNHRRVDALAGESESPWCDATMS